MEEALHQFFDDRSTWVLFGLIGVSLAVLAKAADKLVGEAVVLSERSGLPKVIIGATIVSLGTTAPEAAVSVLAALQGDPGIALGNAAGSIICDTGLILGIACLIKPLKLPRQIVNRQGWLQLGSGVLLVAMCWPWAAWPWQLGGNPLKIGGVLPQAIGCLFVVLLLGYLWLSVYWARHSSEEVHLEEFEKDAAAPLGVVVGKLLIAVLLVVVASHLLVQAISIVAVRLGVPSAVIAATLVAFGTSLPELVTAVVAARKDHGDLAVGNIIGADILNVLFVAGTSAAVTTGGLVAPASFFQALFPAMLLVLVVFRVGVMFSGDRLRRPFGVVSIVVYTVAMVSLAILR